MTDQSRYPDAADSTRLDLERESPPRMPRWVWVSAVIVGGLLGLAVVLMLVSGGQHGPARHTSSGGISISTITDVDSLLPLASARE